MYLENIFLKSLNKNLDTLLWKGQTTIAAMTTTGGSWSESYRPENMFDGDIRTFWFSQVKNVTIQVTFKKPIMFRGFHITARHEKVTGSTGTRYQHICAYLHGSQTACTHPTKDVANSEVLTAKPATIEQATIIEIRFPSGKYAEVAELEILYGDITGTLGSHFL